MFLASGYPTILLDALHLSQTPKTVPRVTSQQMAQLGSAICFLLGTHKMNTALISLLHLRYLPSRGRCEFAT